MPLSENSIFSGSWSKTQNSGQNRIYPSLTLLTAKFFPLKKGFKKVGQSSMILYILNRYRSFRKSLVGRTMYVA